jgi:membrane protein YqaA with SNARE-associated domain
MNFKLPFSAQTRTNIARILVLLAVIGLSIFIYTIRDQAQKLALYGYPGVFLLAFLSYATVLLPAPGVAVVFGMGAILNPYGVALAAGSGAALGEISGYLAGVSGRGAVANSARFQQITGWMQRGGPWAVFLLSAIPNPLFDLAGVAAGVAKMPFWRFLFFCWLGETVKMLAFALVGSSSLSGFIR